MILLGSIDNATRTAVMNLGGHSLSTTMKYYVKHDRINEVIQVGRVFPNHYNQGRDVDDEQDEDEEEPRCWPMEDELLDESDTLGEYVEEPFQQPQIPHVLPAYYGYPTHSPQQKQQQHQQPVYYNEQSPHRPQDRSGVLVPPPGLPFEYRRVTRVIHADWGLSHPQIDMNRKRADWSNDEVKLNSMLVSLV